MPYTRDECRDALRQAAAELDAVPTMDEYDRVSSDDQPTANTIAHRLDGWRDAVDQLDIEDSPRLQYTKQDCLDALRDAAEELGEEPTQHAYQRLGLSPSMSTIQDRFPSWKAAKAEADVVAWGARRE